MGVHSTHAASALPQLPVLLQLLVAQVALNPLQLVGVYRYTAPRVGSRPAEENPRTLSAFFVPALLIKVLVRDPLATPTRFFRRTSLRLRTLTAVWIRPSQELDTGGFGRRTAALGGVPFPGA